jgi:hypothetical protein
MIYKIAYDKITKKVVSILRAGNYDSTITPNPDFEVVEVDSVLGETIKSNSEEYIYDTLTMTFVIDKLKNKVNN